jgi:hypothetical protein
LMIRPLTRESICQAYNTDNMQGAAPPYVWVIVGISIFAYQVHTTPFVCPNRHLFVSLASTLSTHYKYCVLCLWGLNVRTCTTHTHTHTHRPLTASTEGRRDEQTQHLRWANCSITSATLPFASYACRTVTLHTTRRLIFFFVCVCVHAAVCVEHGVHAPPGSRVDVGSLLGHPHTLLPLSLGRVRSASHLPAHLLLTMLAETRRATTCFID